MHLMFARVHPGMMLVLNREARVIVTVILPTHGNEELIKVAIKE